MRGGCKATMRPSPRMTSMIPLSMIACSLTVEPITHSGPRSTGVRGMPLPLTVVLRAVAARVTAYSPALAIRTPKNLSGPKSWVKSYFLQRFAMVVVSRAPRTVSGDLNREGDTHRSRRHRAPSRQTNRCRPVCCTGGRALCSAAGRTGRSPGRCCNTCGWGALGRGRVGTARRSAPRGKRSRAQTSRRPRPAASPPP